MKTFLIRRSGILFFVFMIGCSGTVLIGPDNGALDQEIEKNKTHFESDRWTERVLALDQVSSLNRPGSERLLIRGLEDPHSRVRIAAAKGLASFRNDESFNAVFYTAQFDADSNVRWEALKTVSLFKSAETVPLLISECRNPDWVFRETAIAALLDIEHPGVRKASIPIAIDGLDDVSENVRVSVMNHLQITDQHIYSILVRQLSVGSYYRRPGYLKAVIRALSLYKLDKEARSIVLNLLTHPDPEVRVLALRAIKNSDDMQ